MLAAEIIAIGSELLAPDRTDTNSLWLTDKLNRIGIDVKLKTIVGDDDARLEELVKDAVKRSRVVITTGGLGPTEDDITRKVVARALGRRLALDESVLAEIRARFQTFRYAPRSTCRFRMGPLTSWSSTRSSSTSATTRGRLPSACGSCDPGGGSSSSPRIGCTSSRPTGSTWDHTTSFA